MAAVILVFKLSDGTIRKLVIVDEPRPAMTTAQIAILVAVIIGIIIAIIGCCIYCNRKKAADTKQDLGDEVAAAAPVAAAAVPADNAVKNDQPQYPYGQPDAGAPPMGMPPPAAVN